MTEWMDYPHTPHQEHRFMRPEPTLPLDGTMPVHKGKGGQKVTGRVYVTWQRAGHAQVATAAHINDDHPGIEYRGKGYLARVNFTRDASTGEWSPEQRPHVSDRGSWSLDGPAPTITAAIVSALAHHLAQHWTPEMDAHAEHAELTRDLARAEEDLAKAEQAAQVARKAHDDIVRAREALGFVEDERER